MSILQNSQILHLLRNNWERLKQLLYCSNEKQHTISFYKEIQIMFWFFIFLIYFFWLDFYVIIHFQFRKETFPIGSVEVWQAFQSCSKVFVFGDAYRKPWEDCRVGVVQPASLFNSSCQDNQTIRKGKEGWFRNSSSFFWTTYLLINELLFEWKCVKCILFKLACMLKEYQDIEITLQFDMNEDLLFACVIIHYQSRSTFWNDFKQTFFS